MLRPFGTGRRMGFGTGRRAVMPLLSRLKNELEFFLLFGSKFGSNLASHQLKFWRNLLPNGFNSAATLA